MITNNYTPYQGGVVSSINATVQALHDQGHQVTLVTLNFLGKGHADPAWVKRLSCPIRFVYKKNHMACAWRTKKQLSDIFDAIKPDVVHVHHPFLLGYRAAHIAKSRGLPVLFTYHTMYEEYAHYLALPAFLVKKCIRLRVRAFCNLVDGVVAPSNVIRAYLHAQGVKKPIEVIPSALQEVFLGSERMVRPVANGSLRLLVVGRMVKEKNMQALLRVARHLSGRDLKYTFTLVGYGAEYESLQAYAYQELKLNPAQVVFVHQPDKARIVQCYRESDLFLFSSHTDTQGIVLAEAMALGTPVIALDGPGQRDIIVQGCNGYIVASEEDMVDRIISLSSDAVGLERLSQQAFDTVRAYRPEVLGKRLLAFYEQIKRESI